MGLALLVLEELLMGPYVFVLDIGPALAAAVSAVSYYLRRFLVQWPSYSNIPEILCLYAACRRVRTSRVPDESCNLNSS